MRTEAVLITPCFTEWWTGKTATAQNMKFFIKHFFTECDQIRKKLRIWLNLLKSSLMEKLYFCALSALNHWILVAQTLKIGIRIANHPFYLLSSPLPQTRHLFSPPKMYPKSAWHIHKPVSNFASNLPSFYVIHSHLPSKMRIFKQ